MTFEAVIQLISAVKYATMDDADIILVLKAVDATCFIEEVAKTPK